MMTRMSEGWGTAFRDALSEALVRAAESTCAPSDEKPKERGADWTYILAGWYSLRDLKTIVTNMEQALDDAKK